MYREADDSLSGKFLDMEINRDTRHRNGIARPTDVVKRAVRMCKRCFKTCVVGGEVLTNGITLCLLVIRSLVEGPLPRALPPGVSVSFSSKTWKRPGE